MTGNTTQTTSRIYISRHELLNLRYENPQPVARQTLRNNTGLAGEILSSVKGQGIEFTDIRPYQPGDEVRHIDWRTTARTGTPYTREYNEERQQTIYLSIDQRINMFFGSGLEFKSYTAARIAGTITWAAVARGLRLGGTVIGERGIGERGIGERGAGEREARERGVAEKATGKEHHNTTPDITATSTKDVSDHYTGAVRTGRSKQSALKLINELTLTNNALSVHCEPDNNEGAGLEKMLNQTLAHRPSGSTVFLISDFHGFNADNARLLAALGKKCHIVMILISDPLEEKLPDSGTVGISNGVQYKTIRLTGNRRKTYQQKRNEFRGELQYCADSIGARLVHQSSNPGFNDWSTYAHTT